MLGARIPIPVISAFMLSGMSGLIYQICWQRLLFTNFGVDVHSVTILVSAFMAGLGLGGWAGGRIADKAGRRGLHIFVGVELMLCLLGLVSHRAILWLGEVTPAENIWLPGLANFILLLPPTFLMGMTLPLLTTYFSKDKSQVGSAIGGLYTVNTIGAAVGVVFAGFVAFNFMTIADVIRVAALGNFIVALGMVVYLRREKV
ncbi:membrane protein [Jeongeupia sp. HS-3]|nr:membrane protein [Jeongeupia sp. HS-3]